MFIEIVWKNYKLLDEVKKPINAKRVLSPEDNEQKKSIKATRLLLRSFLDSAETNNVSLSLSDVGRNIYIYVFFIENRNKYNSTSEINFNSFTGS